MNFRFYLKALLVLLLAIFLVLIQFSVISFLNYPWYLLDLLVPALIFLFLLADHRLAWLLAIFSAWFLDSLSFNLFGLELVSLLLVVWLIDSWLRNWFTKHSIYSFLVLGAVAVLLRNLIFYGLLFIVSRPGPILFSRKEFWLDLAGEMLGTVVLVSILFYLALRFNRRLKPFFLGKKPLS